MRALLILMLISALALGSSGCLLAVGAGAAGGAYEYSNKKDMERLEAEFKQGKISKKEYLRRKRKIQKESLVY